MSDRFIDIDIGVIIQLASLREEKQNLEAKLELAQQEVVQLQNAAASAQRGPKTRESKSATLRKTPRNKTPQKTPRREPDDHRVSKLQHRVAELKHELKVEHERKADNRELLKQNRELKKVRFAASIQSIHMYAPTPPISL